MKKTIHCCDICGKEILSYDGDKDCLRLVVEVTEEPPLPVGVTKETSNPPEVKTERRDLCLHCLVTTTNIASKTGGVGFSTTFLTLLDKRSREAKE